jgi:tetraprenyl-beta-curcumene synthase
MSLFPTTMGYMQCAGVSNFREIRSLLFAGVCYWLTILPRARLEIRRCRRRALGIHDPTLRAHALDKLARERLNPEAAAFFALLAPHRRRGVLVRLLVDFQIAYDYLDAINEQPAAASLRNGLQLHRALSDAVRAQPASTDYYLHHPQRDDNGYLAGLVTACRQALQLLPSAGAIEPALVSAAERCGEGQSHNHAVLVEGEEQLIKWTASLKDTDGYLWWELAAAGISCLVLHALFALAACVCTLADAERVDGAYFPSVCALSALLDSLIDRADDAQGTNHSFVAHYSSAAETAQRFATIAGEARTLSSRLRRSPRHAVILAGIASYYLSAPEARSAFARSVAARTLERLGPATRPTLAVMRWRRSTS